MEEQQTYPQYKSKIYNEETHFAQLEQARKAYGVDFTNIDWTSKYNRQWIPFNLEREYVDRLIENKKYPQAQDILLRMRKSYNDENMQNFIEIYEYRLDSILHANRNLLEVTTEAKKEFNQHTITIVSLVVGIVTIFGAANITIQNTNYNVAINNFFAIVFAIVILTLVAFWANSFFSKQK